jgi:hypothetical protein
MRVLGLAPIGLRGEDTQGVTDIMYMAILYFTAMAAGFRENLAFALLSRVIKTVLGGEQEEEEPSTPSPPVTTGTP